MTKRYLKGNGLLVVPFDKGTGICTVKEEKLNEILNLEQFAKINPTNKNAKEICVNEEQRINNVLQDFYKGDKIVEKTLKKLKLTGGQLPRLYELTKVHKNNVPLHPVIYAWIVASQNYTKSYGFVISNSRIKNK